MDRKELTPEGGLKEGWGKVDPISSMTPHISSPLHGACLTQLGPPPPLSSS
jgi:hypothetical protein